MESTVCKRNYALDITRIVAVFAVVMIHCCAQFVALYPPFSTEFIIGNLLNSISRIGTPLFLMISGSLFLDENKQVTLKSVFSKNIKPLFIITIIWATIYSAVCYIAFPLFTSKPIDWRHFVSDIIEGHYHMWYLYMIMGLYMITPFLKKFVSKENKAMVLFFIIVSFCFQFSVPVIQIICKLGLNISILSEFASKFQLSFFDGYIAYYLAGWYIVHVGIPKKWVRCLIYASGTVSLAFIILYSHFTGDYNRVYQYIGAPVFIYSISAFLALNNMKWNLKENTAKKLTACSKLTFGVYIVHIMVLIIANYLLPFRSNSILYLLVSFIVVVGCSFLISFVFSKIPVLKKLVKA